MHLVAGVRLGGFRLLDTQFVTTHLSQFGATEVPRDDYKTLLALAVDARATWRRVIAPDELRAELQALTVH